MTGLEYHAIHELKHELRKEVSQKVRDNCADADPMAQGITVMLGTIWQWPSSAL